MTKPTSRNLWGVKMQHMAYQTLWILASTAEKAAQKAISFTRKHDALDRSVVKEVSFEGTIDVF